MIIINSLNEVKSFDKSVVTIGKFDGIHKGHEVLIEKTVNYSKQEQLTSVVFTFKNSPISYFSNIITREIITEVEKMNKLKLLGVDVVIDIPFNKDMAEISAEDFVKQILVDKLGAKKLIIGHDFAFARKREGTPPILKILGKKYGFDVEVIEPVVINNIRVSSTHVKDLIYAGRVDEIKNYLGRNYAIEGTVIHAKQLGRTLGFPTANLRLQENLIIPKRGIYATKVHIGNEVYVGATNIGYNPTVNGEKMSVETNILQFDKDIYGKTIKLEFLERIRDEKKFKDLNELKLQLKMDTNYIYKKYICKSS
ncbi:MAG: bifunctional riboflavin kinase/FAD synthetase [Terrisporobacter othiniensis]|uniref:Riboflavin biosynthesis protein n=1 Tax=Terrisporobacter hibernicus TaxID=2813371 RepID=A0AAX2ZF32_9FIRM|nr:MULTISPECIES: bifunctional riboflavin kinase/FAD synthetase [Terrisporobacter]MBN9646368.1 bifunctional riboflavin kinase/FAD synthetase [Terrisporobacter glycolicus]MDU4859682.1 bifunctional riboflavin kinase/FAD synthetase [Terrisporobacter othiniensis]MDU6994149.1 bifunctional riboflavin kinase/FAD synthetase [Terrisporobacter othiniensis]UEL46965.1 bifunctional riboflavin kinase/FAD synthetase [Terrisporobacter hibernicus]